MHHRKTAPAKASTSTSTVTAPAKRKPRHQHLHQHGSSTCKTKMPIQSHTIEKLEPLWPAAILGNIENKRHVQTDSWQSSLITKCIKMILKHTHTLSNSIQRHRDHSRAFKMILISNTQKSLNLICKSISCFCLVDLLPVSSGFACASPS